MAALLSQDKFQYIEGSNPINILRLFSPLSIFFLNFIKFSNKKNIKFKLRTAKKNEAIKANEFE
jgi:hypothetical protein